MKTKTFVIMVLTSLLRSRPLVRAYQVNKNIFIRALSTKPQDLSSLQKGCWDTYLSSGRGTDTLFESIDAGHTQKLPKKEIHMFLKSVNHQGVHPRAFGMIEEIAEDHHLTLDEFTSWGLVLAGKFGNAEAALASEAVEDDFEEDEDFHTWNEQTMNQAVRNMQYAVRGEVVNQADELQAEGKEVLFTNIGNPQAVGQSPVTYYRQVMALCDLPAEAGVDHPEATKMFPPDVIAAKGKRNERGHRASRYRCIQWLARYNAVPKGCCGLYPGKRWTSGIPWKYFLDQRCQ
jgi:hypothetical protein